MVGKLEKLAEREKEKKDEIRRGKQIEDTLQDKDME